MRASEDCRTNERTREPGISRCSAGVSRNNRIRRRGPDRLLLGIGGPRSRQRIGIFRLAHPRSGYRDLRTSAGPQHTATVVGSISDGTLLLAWREGDASAGQALFERHYTRLARFFRSKVADDHSDLVQRTFLAIVEGRERLRAPGDFRRYLFGIAYRQLFKHFAQRERALTHQAFLSQSAAALGPSPASWLEGREQVTKLLHALRSLPLELQIAFELQTWEGLTAAEIADVLSIPHGTAKTRVRQARLRLGEALADDSKPESATPLALEAWANQLRTSIDEQTSVDSEG